MDNVLYHPWFDDSKKQPLLIRFREGHSFIATKYGPPLYVLVSRVDFLQLFPDMPEAAVAEHRDFPGLKIEHTQTVQKDTFFFVYAGKDSE